MGRKRLFEPGDAVTTFTGQAGMVISEAVLAAAVSSLVSERKLGFFVQIKEGENLNRRNTLSISRINPARAGLSLTSRRGGRRKRQFWFRHYL